MKQFKNYNLSLLAVTVISLFIIACSSDDSTPKDSTADFSVSISDLDVSFTSNTKYAVSLSWDFGDGETSTTINPTHTYSEAGDYSVTLTTVAAVGGNPDTITKTISVLEINPKANFTFEIDDKTVTFTNTSERAVSYEWDFGDGESSTEENPAHTYAEYGDYSITLTTTGVENSTPAMVTKTLTLELGGAFVSVDVENVDFSLPGAGKQSNWDNVPGWNSDTTATDSGVEEGDAGWFAFKKSNDPSVYNLTDHVIAANEEFKINLDASESYNTSQIIVTLYYDTGDGVRNVLADQTFDLLPDNATANFELTANASSASVGAKLGIMIDNISTDGNDGWTNFSNVQLFAK
ncbi:PKD repeat-containing protein [Flaviramulus basaltis]|uniref:PKD repeat-containing protein n=1 Tax=Flaviramulus basaltis TaxID=369401 RepID=A0A1K2IPA0_9FLAO|nr:PKD domain-containing protein [Flaviramulus basaltis]SFZ94082.1 PKD repeat-containing protein [Flaviramulus basaltis]